VTDATRKEMKKILEEIQEGVYAETWIAENRAGRPSFEATREKEQGQLLETVGAELREKMPFLHPVRVGKVA
jgi:ketol-acid reductoisomerase